MANILILSFFIASYVTASYYRYYSPYQTISEFPNNYLNPFYTSPYSTSSSQTSTFRAIENAKTHTQTPTRSIDSLFLRLPSSYELDELILSSDSVALLRTIQTVATDDSIPCR